MSGGQAGPVDAASRLLRELLAGHPAYRRTWQKHVQRDRTQDISRAGIAQVIAEYLWDAGERADTDTNLARRLRDRVRRALDGDKLTAETLTWFIRAFEMTENHEHRLWAALAGGPMDYTEGISGTLSTSRPMLRPMRHRTVTMFERYAVDARRNLSDRHVMRVIAALEDGVDRYVYTQEPITARIDVLAGGQLDGHVVHDGRILHDIVLTEPLRKGYTASLEYRTYYTDNHSSNETRRAFPGRYDNVDLAIQFDPQQLPRSIWFATWSDHYTGEPVHRESLTLDSTNSAHRFVPYVEQSVLGFCWEW